MYNGWIPSPGESWCRVPSQHLVYKLPLLVIPYEGYEGTAAISTRHFGVP